MKIDYIYSACIAGISAMLAWGAYELQSAENLQIITAIVTFLALTISGICSFALKAGEERSSIMARVASAVIFFFMIALNFVFAFFDYSIPLYIILNAITLIILLIANRSIIKTNM